MTDRQDLDRQPPPDPQRDYEQYLREHGQGRSPQPQQYDYQPEQAWQDQPRHYDYPREQPQQQYGYQPEQAWQPRPYDPVAHKERISGPQQSGASDDRPGESAPPWNDYPARTGYPPREQYEPRASDRQYGGPPEPAAPEYPPSWSSRHKVLTGLIIIVVLVGIGAIVKTHKNTPVAGAGTSNSGSASPCLTALESWSPTGGKARLNTLQNDVSALGKATGKFDAKNTTATEAGLRTAAATVRSGASSVEGDAGPACVPKMRAGFLATAKDYAQAATDSTNAVSQVIAGNQTKANRDLTAAAAAGKSGTARLRAADNAASTYSAG